MPSPQDIFGQGSDDDAQDDSDGNGGSSPPTAQDALRK